MIIQCVYLLPVVYKWRNTGGFSTQSQTSSLLVSETCHRSWYCQGHGVPPFQGCVSSWPYFQGKSLLPLSIGLSVSLSLSLFVSFFVSLSLSLSLFVSVSLSVSVSFFLARSVSLCLSLLFSLSPLCLNIKYSHWGVIWFIAYTATFFEWNVTHCLWAVHDIVHTWCTSVLQTWHRHCSSDL